MIIEFVVRNFRSIRDELRFSFVATKDKELSETHLAKTGIPSIPNVVQSAVVFGANASGKSNLILGLAQLQHLVVNSFTGFRPEQPLPFDPFMQSAAGQSGTTEFEITFVLNGVRHQYGFAFNMFHITEEWLHVYVNPKPQIWFHREFDELSGKDKYSYSQHLKGDKDVWENATRPNALFLSTAAQHNSDGLMPIYRWFIDKLVVLPVGQAFTSDQTLGYLADATKRNVVVRLMAIADVGISDIQVDRQKGMFQEIKLKPDGSTEVTRGEREVLRPQFVHRSGDHTFKFDLHNESQGTQKLFNLTGPIFDILQHGKTLVVDELDGSLHPLLVRRIVEMFHDNELNMQGAQLLFTTHDTSLLDAPNLLRRDQVWLTEKSADHATVLTPLTEFSPRKGEALERGYLMGRYGAVPMLGSFSSALKKSAEHS